MVYFLCLLSVCFSSSLFAGCFTLASPLVLDIRPIFMQCMLDFPWIILTVLLTAGMDVPSEVPEERTFLEPNVLLRKDGLLHILHSSVIQNPFFKFPMGFVKLLVITLLYLSCNDLGKLYSVCSPPSLKKKKDRSYPRRTACTS